MKQFELVFKGKDANENNDWRASMSMTGTSDSETIGMLFAEFAATEYNNGHGEPLKMCIALIEHLRKKMPGMQKVDSGIIKPFSN